MPDARTKFWSNFAFVTLLSGAVVAPAQSLAAQQTERVTLNSKSLAVYNLVGRLKVTGGGSSAVATITRHGKDAARLTVGTSTVDGREALVIRYPGDRVTIPDLPRNRRTRTEVRVREDGSFGSGYSRGDDRGLSMRFRDGRNVRIGDESGGLEAAADIELQVPNGVSARLHLAVGDVDIRNVNGDLAVDVKGANIAISDSRGTLTLDTGSGEATLTNLSGLITLETGSGDVVARNISGEGLIIDSGSGRVALDGCDCTKVSIETGSGSLRVTEMKARNLVLDTGSGNVVLGVSNTPDVITIDSGSGEVVLTLPADYSAVVDIDTGSGTIASDFPLQITSKSRGEMQGKIASGRGRLSIDTGSGSVRLKKAN